MGGGQGTEVVARHAQILRFSLQEPPSCGWVGLVAREAVVLGRSVGMCEAKSSLDRLMTGEAEILSGLFNKALLATVVGRVASLAFALVLKLVGGQFTRGRGERFVADLAQSPTAGAMQDVRVRVPVFLVAPLTPSFSEGLVGGGQVLQFGHPRMAFDAGFFPIFSAPDGHGPDQE